METEITVSCRPEDRDINARLHTFLPFLKPGMSGASARSCFRAFCWAFFKKSGGIVTSTRMCELACCSSRISSFPFCDATLLRGAASLDDASASAEPGRAPSVRPNPASARPEMEGSSAYMREGPRLCTHRFDETLGLCASQGVSEGR